MSNIFEQILNMSITASIIIVIVILLRFLLKNVSKKYSYFLWCIVGFRLCCPFSFNSAVSVFSIIPLNEHFNAVNNGGIMNYINAPTSLSTSIYRAFPTEITDVFDGVSATYAASPVLDSFLDIIPYLWLVGVIGLLLYGVISFSKLKHSMSTATIYQDNIYQSEKIKSPFILGMIKPKIYIPYGIDEEYLIYIISHEKYHLKRRDNIIKSVAFLLLAIHWFNPFCWLAFYLMNKDMEMSCDERVLKDNNDIKKIYSNALLSFAVGNKFPNPSPLCFGESSAKSRIKNILKYKKPSAIASIIVVILCFSVTIVCVANPKSNENSTEISVNDDNYQHFKEYPQFVSSQEDGDSSFLDQYDFIYNSYWYNVITDGDNTVVCCTKYNRDYSVNTTVYTKDKNGNWTSGNESCYFTFDENNTIIYYYGIKYSRSWWYIDTDNQLILERDRNTGEILQTLIQKNENSLKTAKSMLS